MQTRTLALLACLLLAPALAGCTSPTESSDPTPDGNATSPTADVTPTVASGARPATFDAAASFEDKAPCVGTDATLLVDVSRDGFGLAGATVEARWRNGSANATTDADGFANVTIGLADAQPDRTIVVDVRITHEGELARVQARVTPRACDADGEPIMPPTPSPTPSAGPSPTPTSPTP